MSFYASNFIYDKIPSSNYSLKISDTSSDSEISMAGANVTIISQDIYRKPKVYLYGVKQSPVLEIPISIFKHSEITAQEATYISKWLFGQMEYKQLQIIQPDMQDVYYNCIFINPQVVKIGNIIRGFRATISCDSPYAWTFPQIIYYNYSPNTYYIEKNIIINNTGDSPDYIYPKMEIKMNTFGGDIKITNFSDSERVFEIKNLEKDEILSIDNDMQTISSSLGINRLSNITGYKWFRLSPKVNSLLLSGNIEYIKFTNQFPKKIV